IYPFTDLLLHDMGPGLADGREDFDASGTEWRTSPLWGIGATKASLSNSATYLHDGRARSLLEAILWHGGEAENAKVKFTQLSSDKRE
ncbi:MAG: thiol oxidoreductase, partial [Bdellovibrionales bacterium]|nr:thiol oxidoreductase [Bdellovibrionales bacterium]